MRAIARNPIAPRAMRVAMDLAARIAWSFDHLHRLIARGRREGWLAGEPHDAPPPRALDDGAAPMARLLRLGLARGQLELIWLLACVELDPGLSRVLHEIAAAPVLTVQLVERLAALAGWTIAPADLDELAALGLVDLTGDRHTPLARRTIRATDRVLDLARGIWGIDRTLGGAAAIVVATSAEPAPEVAEAFATAADAIVVAVGVAGSGRTRALLAALAPRRCLVIDAAAFTDADAPQLAIALREARLHETALVVRDLDATSGGALIETLAHPRWRGLCVAVTARASLPRARGHGARALVAATCPIPDASARAVLWKDACPALADADARALATRYAIAPGLVREVAAIATTPAAIQVALRARLERDLLGLATRVEVTQTWDDLVLPDDQLELVEELVGRARCRTTVLDDWGFGDKVGRGVGIAALFSGPPGTGKTMVAGLIARELGLDLYQIDLAKVVSKYIGETEKQLGAVFDAAEAGHAILLFDEADALFGKRSEVKSSTDRYANLEVNYLLQRLEAFRGIALLTTNHESAIDRAFARRLAVHLRMPLPDEAQRAALWRAMIPARAACAGDLDHAGLARDYAMSGGYIKNAAVRAAYAAAVASSPITSAHLRRAARAELETIGRITLA